jgi:hypothetical protein
LGTFFFKRHYLGAAAAKNSCSSDDCWYSSLSPSTLLPHPYSKSEGEVTWDPLPANSNSSWLCASYLC